MLLEPELEKKVLLTPVIKGNRGQKIIIKDEGSHMKKATCSFYRIIGNRKTCDLAVISLKKENHYWGEIMQC